MQGKRARQKRKRSLKGFYAVSRLYFTQKAMDKYFAAFRTKKLDQTDQILALPITS